MSCGGNCGCGSGCSCGSSCNGCSMYPGLAENTTTTTQVLIAGVAPAKSSCYEMSNGSENDGCSCGSSCSCDPCTCK